MKVERNKKRDIIFALVSILLSTLISLVAAEYGLRWYQQSINNSSKGDPGLLRYDARLGWTLTPNWQGRHQHHDFDVRYTINKYGYRGQFPNDLQHKDRIRIAIIGDSFSFGLGVNDDDTFTTQLNRQQSHIAFLDFSVPGYSTDQQLLLMESRLDRFQADEYILMIYLANDILDIMLPYPLQTEQAKPYFSLDDDRQLVLKNVPTPRDAKPAKLRSMSLNNVIFGDSLKDIESASFLNRSQIVQRLIPSKAKADRETVFTILDERLRDQKRLMKTLMEKLKIQTSNRERRLRIGLLSGRSFILNPASYSAYFQDYVRLFLVELGKELGIPVIDVANEMRVKNLAHSDQWFHPNEGHFSAKGHDVVAEILRDALTDK